MNSLTDPANLTKGGSTVAAELAQFFLWLGVHVTVAQRGDHSLSKFDTDATTVIEEVFRRESVNVFTNTELTDARSEGDHKLVAFQHFGLPMTIMPHKRQIQP